MIRSLKNMTPRSIKQVWWKVKKKTPFKQIRRWEGLWHRFYLLKIYYPRLYKKYASAPIQENKVIFTEVRLPALTNSFRTLHKAVENENKYEIHDHFLRNSFVTRREYDRRCREMVKDIATAKYVFFNEASNVLACLPLRKETIVTQTWHGCGAFKKFGFSTAEKIFGGNLKEQTKYPFYGNFTHVTLSSPEVTWAYEEAMNMKDHPEIFKPIGISRTDVFYDQDFIAKAHEKMYEQFPESKGKKIILYAPTFRGRVANGKAPNKMNIPLLKYALGDEYVLVIKQHPLVKKRPVIAEQYADFAIDVTETMEIDELLCVADICISDYSSLIFEYSIFEKPMIFFAYDIENYDDWRGFYYNYDEMTPGPILKENEELIDYIKHIDERFDKQEMIDFKYKFMRSCDGHATERLMKLVFGE